MISISPLTQRYSPEAYLALEETARERHEYIDGEIRLMPGGTRNHCKLGIWLCVLLTLAIDSQPYEVYNGDMRLWIPQRNAYTYPDLTIVPQPSETQPGRDDVVINPVLIAEVLSKSTQAYDRGEKFAIYKAIPTLQEYLLIDQYQVEVWQFIKQPDGQWQEIILSGLDATLTLTFANVTIQLADLYQKTDLIPEK
ncbi:Uma2 family endonuclease [Thermosynechococcaceae cyanobacterium BACA0444]|uniref:Uma2 family endonuclease n=1 Tax=Pseudocalidococcus azoricus BACA0444 TaxID=2918990 RepID=A0AAE4FSJ6_9CYAN|nr:Uma2 family endonuclease [Pseudocalidococcus azoricus]MDS3861008.1 Uma2 family endonuclease [Pseudocalidococcus azoricus BACA0444]